MGLGQSPFPVPVPVREALRENAFQKDYLAVHHCRTFGIETTADHVLIGPGSKEWHVQWLPTSAANGWRVSPEQLDALCRTDPGRPRPSVCGSVAKRPNASSSSSVSTASTSRTDYGEGWPP